MNPFIRLAPRPRPAGVLTVLLLPLSLTLSVAAGDWPRFRGPTANGVSPESTAPLQWSTTRGLRWRTELPGPGASSPVVVGDRIFAGAYSGYGVAGTGPADVAKLTHHAVCLNRADGKVLWTREVPQRKKVHPYESRYLPLHGYGSSTPVSDGKLVVFFFGNSGVHAFSPDGGKLWSAEVGDGSHEWGAGASPVLHKDLVIINAAIESDSLIALNRKDGTVAWQVKGGFPRAWNTPVLVDAGGGKLELVLHLNGRVRAFDPDTGKELWFCQGIRAAELCPTIVAHQGVLYVLGHPAGRAMTVKAGGRGDVTKTHVGWQIDKGSNVSSPVYLRDHLYWVNDSRGIVYCAKADTGEIVYEERLTPKPDRFFASPVLVGDRLYYQSRGQGVYVVRAAPKFEQLGRNVVAGADEIFNGSPAVAGGRLYLRSDRALYCIGSE